MFSAMFLLLILLLLLLLSFTSQDFSTDYSRKCFFLKFIPRSLENRSLNTYTNTNEYIECRVQKGCIPKLSGTIEHTQQLAYKIRQAKRKQKTLVVTLLDLKNAFGEVSHCLIPTVLQFYQISREIQNIISELYSGFSTSTVTKTFVKSLYKSKKEFFKVTILVPYYLTCFFILLFKH